MRAVIKSKIGPGAELSEVNIPQIGPGEVLVKVKATAIGGTNIHIYDWDPWASARMKPPRILGHEFAGEVAEVGKEVTTFTVGDYVSCETHIVCGRCFQCQTGLFNLCQNTKIVGVHIDGTFAEYVALPESCLWKTDATIPLEIAAIQEPLGNSLHATLIEGVSGRSVAVFGCGSVGLGAIAIARASGATSIFAVEPNEFRLKLARQMGATEALSPKKSEVIERIMELTGNIGVDVVLEMSGNPQALKQGLKVLRSGGRVSLMGFPSQPVSLNITEDIISKGVRIFGIFGRQMFDNWYTLNSLLTSNRLDIDSLITHKMRLDEFEKAIKLVKSGNCGKVILYPE